MMIDYVDRNGIVYAVIAPLIFPEGISIGSGNGKTNTLQIARRHSGA